MALPQLTDEQRKAALEKAAQARHERAELREKIKSGKVTLEEVLDSDDPIACRMKVSTLIESLPGYGKAKAAKIMRQGPRRPSARAAHRAALQVSWPEELASSWSRGRQVWARAPWSRVCASRSRAWA